ncbi:MAG: bifunctional metallophosphatase/5'-nucleotidase [Chloroflexi bacterium]|nr:bifunctional metallophosphatase/5'-nucleotidase [Chloroflexota bacterium]
MKRSRLAALAALGLLLAVSVPTATAKPRPGSPAVTNAQTTEIQLLSLNDFHGNLEPPGGSGGRIGALNAAGQCVAPDCYLAGGVEYLATHVRDLRATNPNTLFLSAGDLIGATPLISALFHDEPTIEAFNLMDLDYNGVGNHEFDEGVDELLRMQNGGCHPVDGCADGDGFAGADFGFLAANVVYKSSGDTIFPPYAIHAFPGVDVAIVGMTLEGTPLIVTPAGIQTVDFLDEAESVNALVPVLKAQGIETIIVLLHEGGSIGAPGNGAGSVAAINSCNNPTGPIPPIVDAMSDEIDVVITGHTNWAITCVIDGKIVTGAAHQGRLVTDIDLTISRASKDVVAASVNNVIVTRTVAKAADLTGLIAKYGTLVAPLANRVVGSTTGDILRANNAAGESALGDVIADAQLAATSDPLFGGADVAFMNPGGIRADIIASQTPGGEAVGEVTYGELFSVQPFNNVMTVMTCTGNQIDALLEQQFRASGNTILQVPDGFSYTWDNAAAIGSKVDIASIMIDGVPIVGGNNYRVAMNNFLATGGDGFSVFTGCTNPLGGEIDLDVLVTYFEANSPVAPGPQNRITRLN